MYEVKRGMSVTKDFLEKIYAGFLGMNIGIRLGAPVEPEAWDFDRIAKVYGEIAGYLKDYRNFAADDDVNGPVYFLRGLTDAGVGKEFTPDMAGRAWLNYTRNGIGMFWWGGCGVSTEHTAYLNLKAGIPAPLSGSAKTNGTVAAEQIGGQIFVDTWGLIWPGRPDRAAEYARTAASVSHDGNGLHGAAFISACIAEAFCARSMEAVIDAGLCQIPEDCEYAKVVLAVREFYRRHPGDFRECMRFLLKNWGYDRYEGVCHIIPNAGVCILALLYGQGDFNRTVEIASMCGWDTDCNAGNVGTIAGVFYGLEGIKNRYRGPVNDVVITSGISGYLNIMDAASYVKDLAAAACLLTGEEMPEGMRRAGDGELLFDFELPGSTHGIRLSNQIRFMKRHSRERAFSGQGSLEIIVDRILPGDQCHVYYKPFYRRKDFDDERYQPVFSPTVYSGQRFSAQLYPELWIEGKLCVRPYVRAAMRDRYIYGEELELEAERWNGISFVVPDLEGDQAAELGFLLYTPEETSHRVFGHIYLDEFAVTGGADYSIAMEIQEEEFRQLTPFSWNQCRGRIVDGRLEAEASEPGQAFTGSYYAKDVTVRTDITVLEGQGKEVVVRARGAEQYYSLGFGRAGEVRICCHDHGCRVLKSVPYDWKYDTPYELEAVCRGESLTLFINGEEAVSAKDGTHPWGMVGYCQEAGSFSSSKMRVIVEESRGTERIHL